MASATPASDAGVNLAGLARFYTNAWGDEQPIADDTLRTLTALGLKPTRRPSRL